MGRQTISGYRTGKPYTFEFAGDVPSDSDLAYMQQYLLQAEDKRANELLSYGLPVAPVDDGTALGRGWEAGKPQFWSTFGTTLETAGEQWGWDWLDRLGQGWEQQAQIDRAEALGTAGGMRPMTDWRDVSGPSSGLTYIGEQLGMQGPQIAVALGVGAGAAALTASSPFSVPAMAAIGATTGAVSFPQLFGANIQRQEEEVAAGRMQEVDVGVAFKAALGQTALEGISNAVTGGTLGGLLKGTRIPARVAYGMLLNAGTEGATELGQAVLERQQAGLPIDTPEAYAEMLDNAIAGAALGGLFGVGAAISPTAGGAREALSEEPPANGDREEPRALPSPGPRLPSDTSPNTQGELFDDGTVLGQAPAAPVEETVSGVSERIAQMEPPLGGPISEIERAVRTLAARYDIPPDAVRRAYDMYTQTDNMESDIADVVGIEPAAVIDIASTLDALKRPNVQEVTTQQDEAASGEVATEVEQGRAVGEAVTRAATSQEASSAVADTVAAQKAKPVPGVSEELTAREQQDQLAAVQDTQARVKDLQAVQREETTDVTVAEPETITDEVLASIGMPVGYAARKQLASGAPQEKVRQTLQALVDGEGKFSAPVRELLRRTSPEQRAAGDGTAATGRGVGTRQPGVDGRAGGLAGAGPGGVGQPSGNVLVAPTGAQGGADTLAQRAAPGATTGTAGQVIPAGIPGTEYTPQPAQRYDQKLKRVVARREPTEIEQRIEQAAARTASEEKTRATQEFAAWRTKNVPPLVRALSRDYDEGMGHIPDVTTARDRQKILGILRKLPKWDMTKRVYRTERLTEQEFAAGRYFLRNENPMHTLELIAHDAVYGSNVADPEKELRDMKRSGKAGEKAAKRIAKQKYSIPAGMSETAPEVQYHRYTGREFAENARAWIDANLSQDVKDYTNQVAAKNNADLSREFNYYHRMSNPDNDVTTVPRDDLDMQRRYKSDAQRRQAKADLLKAAERAAADYDLQARVNKAGVSLPPAPEGMDMSFLVALNPYGELAMPLHPTVVAALVNGNLESALKSLAMTGISKDMKRLAAALAPYVGNTKVYLEYKGDPYYDARLAPKKRSGAYVVTPDTDSAYNDAIIISADAATPHTLLHEAVHMATHKTLSDPNDPMTAALNKLYRQFESNLKNYYGGKMDLKEFVAEGLSNNHFRAELRRYRPTGEKISTIKTGWDMFVQAVINKIRNLFGKPPKNITTTALSELDRMAYQIMQPTPGLVKETEVSYLTRAAGKAALQRAFNREKPFSVANAMQALSMFVSDKIPQSVKNFTAGLIPLANLEEMSKGVFGTDIGGRLLDIANEMSSTLYNTHQEINASLHPMRDWLDSDVVTPEVKRAFITMVYESTRNQVDMAMTQEQFLKSDALNKLSFADAQGKKKVYQTLKPYADTVRAAGGMGHYKRMRNTFEMLRQQAQGVFKDRMIAITKDKTKTDAVYNELVKKMFSDHLLDPYTPLTRTGDYWLVYTAKDPIFGNTELFKQSFETVSARELAREQLQDMMAGANPDGIADVEIYNNIRTGQQVRRELPALFAKELTDLLDKNGLTADDTIRMQVTDLILDSIPERSFLNSFRGRKEGAEGQAGMKGWTGDNTPLGDDSGGFLGTMHGKMSGMARQIARMQGSAKAQVYRADLAKRAAELSADPRNNPHVISTLQQELDRNADILGRIDRASWSRDVTGGLFFMTLGFNLSSAIINMFALPTMVLGHLAGQYGMVKTAKAMGEAAKLIAGSGTKRKIRRVSEELGPNGEVQYEMVDDNTTGPLSYGILNYDLDDPKNAKIRFLKYLVHEGEKRNQLGRSLVFEMADIDETTDTTGLSSSARGKWDQVRALSGAPFHHSERYARETTMISTYLLELRKLAKGNDFSKLTEADFRKAAYDAVTTTELVNSSVAAAAAPRLAKGDWGSIFLMYKRYMLAMINLQLMQLKQAVAGADPEARRVARWQLAYTYGLLTAFSGVAGVPIYNIVETAWNAFFDDEDEEDFGTLTRIALGELGYKGALNYITGREMASRIGLQDMLFREPVVEQGWPWDYLVGFGGPAVGMTMNIGRAWDLAWEGEGIRSLEAIAPASVRNLVRAGIRYPTEGARTMRGDPVIDDINIVDMVGQAIGFAPARYVQALELNKQYKEIDKAIAEERSKLVKKLNIARRDGDFYRMRELREDIAEFNRENPQYPIEADTLKRSADQFAKTSDKMIHGVSFNAANLAMIKKMMQAWGEPTFWGA